MLVTIIDTILNTDGPILYITDHDKKNQILHELANKNTFKAITFMHPNVLVEHMFYKAKDQMLLEAAVFFGLKPAVVEPWLPYLYTIDCNKDYPTESLQTLQAFKKHLIEKKLIEPVRHTNLLFKDKTIFVDLVAPSSIIKQALKQLETISSYTKITPKTHTPSLTLYAFDTVNDEVAWVARQIRDYAKTHALNDMRIILHHPDYLTTVETMLDMFNVPYYTDQKTTLWEYYSVQHFYTLLSTFKGDVYTALHEALASVQKTTNALSPRLYIKVLKTLNPLVSHTQKIETLFPLIKHTLKTTSVPVHDTPHGIAITSIDNAPLHHTLFHFHLGTVEGYFPKIKTEDDLLTKEEKTIIHYDTADNVNQNNKALIKAHLAQANTIIMTYAKASLSESLYKASFLTELDAQFSVSEKTPTSLTHQPYSKPYDLIKTKVAYDLYATYKQKNDTFKTLYPALKDYFIPFDNQFSGLSKKTLKTVLPAHLSLSYTKLNSYFKCKFQFLMDHLLKVDPQEDSIHLDLGNLFHGLLETHLDDDAIEETAIEIAINDICNTRANVTAKDRFFLNQSIAMLKDAFSVIKAQMAQSDYNVKEKEGQYTKAYDQATLVGIIDKVMIRKTEAQTHILLIDYKTGNPTLNLPHLLHGLNVQLLYYVLLYTHTNPTHTVKGFYEQTVMLKPKKQDDLTKKEAIKKHLALKGYTEDNPKEILHIDKGALDDPFIDKLKFNKNGSLSAYTKTYTEADLALWINHLDSLIQNAIHDIKQGDFTINPKRDKNKDLSCKYCPYKDICYKSENDYITYNLPKEKDLNDALEEVHNEMD
ncbi:MAG: PD-(D/E)XK nuclease family protein [Bacillota bacterium]